MGDLSTPDSVQKLQTALHAKAKAEPGYRFYALYDKISREDILAHAYAQCRSNKGAPGVDRQDFEAVEAYGVERWLKANWRLRSSAGDFTDRTLSDACTYRKANGKLRPLGIPTSRVRVCMTAAMLVLVRIFEADLPSELYACHRPGRNAQQGGGRGSGGSCGVSRPPGSRWTPTSRTTSGAFRIPSFWKSVSRRIVDRRVLHLDPRCGWIAPWKKPTIEDGRHARPRREDKRRGIPQGLHPSHRCWPIFTCAGSCSDGRCSGLSEPSALAS